MEFFPEWKNARGSLEDKQMLGGLIKKLIIVYSYAKVIDLYHIYIHTPGPRLVARHLTPTSWEWSQRWVPMANDDTIRISSSSQELCIHMVS